MVVLCRAVVNIESYRIGMADEGGIRRIDTRTRDW
jgi:hypothetical protein